MKVTKEPFNKLNQLDRIELRQRLITIDIAFSLFGISGLLLFLFSTIFTMFGIVFLSIILKILGYIMVYKLIKSFKIRKELYGEYFEVQVKRNERGDKK